MIKATYICAAIVILLAGVDWLRIKKDWVQHDNIKHKTSVALAVIACVAEWLILRGIHFTWLYLFQTIVFGLISVTARGTFYDPFLNIFRREYLDYVSEKTSSQIDQRSNKIGFWPRRLLYAGSMAVILLITTLVLKW